MGWFSGWFKKTESDDYEHVLAVLKLDIDKRRTRLSELRLRERRATLLTTLYALAAWGAYASLWYVGALPRVGGVPPRAANAAKLALVLLGPVLVLLNRRLVQLWYTRKGDAEEKSLKQLYSTQQAKIEEIKKKTDYYRTRDIIAKYDDPPSASARQQQQRPPLTPQQQQQQQQMLQQRRPPVTPQRGQVPVTPQTQMQTPVRAALQNQLSPTPPQPLPPPRKQWFDKLADAILGDDGGANGGNGAESGQSRYALICRRCFAHNGLVKESMWEDTQYVCPKCGFFNASPRALKSGAGAGAGVKSPLVDGPASSQSPSSPVSPSPQPPHAQPPHAQPAQAPPHPTSPTPVAGGRGQRAPPGPSNLRRVSPAADEVGEGEKASDGEDVCDLDGERMVIDS